MAKRQIVLEVTFKAISRSDEFIPDSTAAEDSVVLVIPNMDNKFVVFPKILEGVTIGVIRTHQENVRAYLTKKADEERKRREYAQLGLPYEPRREGPQDGDDEPDDDSAFDDDEEDEGDSDEADPVDEDQSPTNPSGIDFGRIVEDVAAGLRAHDFGDGVETEVRFAPRTTKEE